MEKQAIQATRAPAAVGPYSHAVKCGDYLFCSGQIGLDPSTGKLVEGGIAEQTHQVFANIKEVLGAAGATYADVIKATCFLADMSEFGEFNKVYASYFEAPFPARSCFGVSGLPAGGRVEVEVIAHIKR